MTNRLAEMREELQALPGQRVVKALRELDRPVRVLLVPNGQELDQWLADFEKPETILLFAMGNQEHMDAYLGEVQRRTHNLVASVKTAIDHTRRILQREWPDETHPIRQEFLKARQVFETDGWLVVIPDLRNFFLHVSMPGIVGRMHLNAQVGRRHSVHLSRGALLAWDRLRSPARVFLSEADDDIELRPLAAGYVRAAVELQSAVIQSIRTHEGALLTPWQALVDEYNAHLRELLRNAPSVGRTCFFTCRPSGCCG